MKNKIVLMIAIMCSTTIFAALYTEKQIIDWLYGWLEKAESQQDNQQMLNISLAIAVVKKNDAQIKRLINSGADVNIPDFNPLLYAVQNNKYDLINFLMEHGADPYLELTRTANVIKFLQRMGRHSDAQRLEKMREKYLQASGAFETDMPE
jgi:ankyrin repeat protein